MAVRSLPVPDGPSRQPQRLLDKTNRRFLFVSHFLSTWNSRGFEFGAVLFLAAIFADTLFPMSVYALCRAGAAIVFSPIIGRYIDTTNRLKVVRESIVGQRLAVVLSCLLFWCLIVLPYESTKAVRIAALVGLSVLACIEKLGIIMNTIAIERDWVNVITMGEESMLQELNAQIRRIDLFCKLVSPLAIALLSAWSIRLAVFTTFSVNLSSVIVEYFLIAYVFRRMPALSFQHAKTPVHGPEVELNTHVSTRPAPFDYLDESQATLTNLNSSPTSSTSAFHHFHNAVTFYTTSPAFLPSLSLSLLYLTVLSFSGQMTTYLLFIPLSATTVGLLRTLSTILEISSTWIAPYITSQIGPTRSAVWFLSAQLLSLTFGVFGLLLGPTRNSQTAILLTGVILSRLFLWSYDLTAQYLIQSLHPSPTLAQFSSIEASLQNFFELLTFSMTIVWPRPEQFRYPAMISVGAVCVAAALVAKFVRDQRGHLLHLPECLKGFEYKTVSTREEDGVEMESMDT